MEALWSNMLSAFNFLQFFFFVASIGYALYLSLIFVQQQEKRFLYRLFGYGYVFLALLIAVWMILLGISHHILR